MDIWPKYKSPLGYLAGDSKIDTYGVDHSKFSLRDEIAYQMARSEREGQLIKNLNSQGITKDYPQYGTNFWGGNADNNYDFGSSDISENIENVTNSLKNKGFSLDQNTGAIAIVPQQKQTFAQPNTTAIGQNNALGQQNNALGQQNNALSQQNNALSQQNQNAENIAKLYSIPSLQNNSALKPLDNTNSYTTESAWSYPNKTSAPFYEKITQSIDNNDPNTTQKIEEYKLGLLSRLKESDNGKKLWNNGETDKTGGWSYGLYQIATKTGTMNDYLKYLLNHPSYLNFYNTLQQAGGNASALLGSEQFKKAWADLSQNNDFLQSQQDFIFNKKLNIVLRKIKDIKGLNLDKRSPVIRDVIFSTAVQHGEGGASTVFHNALGNDASHLSNEDIINLIYNERSKVKKYFSKSSPETQDSLKDRFLKECQKAQELLKKYP